MERYLGESIPKLGFGLMRLPKNDGEIDIRQVSAMADLFLERGFKYFDTAWGYPGSEIAIGKALCERVPREDYLLATKWPAWLAKSREEAHAMFDMSLERTKAGYFDFYLAHNLGEARTQYFEDYGIWELLAQKKEEGLIRHLGFSFHDKAEVLEKILGEHPEMEFVQLQINYADWESASVESRKCYETARKYGKPVVIMEPIKGGNLMTLPEEAMQLLREADAEASPASWAIRFAASLDGVITVLSGMSSLEQMDANTQLMQNFTPLSEKEMAALSQVREILDKTQTVPCTSCGYCAKGCPMNVAIPGIFEALNIWELYHNEALAKPKYNWNTRGHGKANASACVECGNCETVCPQHIHIRDELKKAAAVFDV